MPGFCLITPLVNVQGLSLMRLDMSLCLSKLLQASSCFKFCTEQFMLHSGSGGEQSRSRSQDQEQL